MHPVGSLSCVLEAVVCKKNQFLNPPNRFGSTFPPLSHRRRDPEKFGRGRAHGTARAVATRGRYARPLSSSTEEPWCPCAQFAARGRPNSKAATKLKISNRRRQRRRRRRDELFGAATGTADASRAPQWNDGTPSQVTSWIEADEFQRAVLRWQNERSSSAGGPS